MIFEGLYTKVELTKSKDELIQILHPLVAKNIIQANFFDIGAKVLSTIVSPSVLSISKIERSLKNVSVQFIVNGGQTLPDYLAALPIISDELFSRLVKECYDGIEAIHEFGFFHQAINPTSFWVDNSSSLKLTIYQILEARFFQSQEILDVSNPSIKYIYDFLSPERKLNFKSTSFSDDYYSFGLIVWYIWCWKSGRINNNNTTQSLPSVEEIDSPWNKLIQYCTHPEINNRPKSITDLKAILNSIQKQLNILPIQKTVADEINNSDQDITLQIINYSEKHFNIICDGLPIHNLLKKNDGKVLTIIVPINVIIDIFRISDNSLFNSFNTNDVQSFTLPVLLVETSVKEKEVINSASTTNTYNKPKNSSKFLIAFILCLFLILSAFILYKFFMVKPSSTFTENNSYREMIPPDGYEINDTSYNNLLRIVGYNVAELGNTKWRFIEGNWEKFLSQDGSTTNDLWQIDNSQSQVLLDMFFRKTEIIYSQGDMPNDQQLVSGNDSILNPRGKLCFGDKFYRFVNQFWYVKEGSNWKKLLANEDFSNIQKYYFVKKELLSNPIKQGYIEGINIYYRSEPYDGLENTKVGRFKDYQKNEDEEFDRINFSGDYVDLLVENYEWCLVLIKSNNKICWTEKKFFKEIEPEEDEDPMPEETLPTDKDQIFD